MRKKVIGIGAICLLILVLAAFAEKSNLILSSDGEIQREAPGAGDKQVDLVVDVEDIGEKYNYHLDVKEQKVSKKAATEYFAKAKEEIQMSFSTEGIDHITGDVSMEESYVGGLVEAEWYLDDYSVVDVLGSIKGEPPEEGKVVNATVNLRCGDYEDIYCFAFAVYPRLLNEEDSLINAIDKEIAIRLDEKGMSTLVLPTSVNGRLLRWTQKRENLVAKVALLELVILILLYFISRERQKNIIEERKSRMKLDYPDIVSKMAVLMGSGMTIEQSWNRISARYLAKRDKRMQKLHPIYEEMAITQREIADGENTKRAYQKFADRTDLGCYQRLSRLLMQSMTKGNRGICEMLDKESSESFKERRNLARKLGEEASTKMLLPLLLMLAVVMAIVMVPALLTFKG